jgi:hypothetical protein
MLALHTATFPSSAADLERLLNESLQRLFISKPAPVTVSDNSYPRLHEIKISLDGARLRPEPPRPPSTFGERSPALEVDHLTVTALRFSIGPAAFDLSVTAAEVQFDQSKDSDEQVILSLKRATEGHIKLSIPQSDLEALITKLAREEASRQGLTIDGVQLALHRESAHSLAVEMRLRARKLFLAASIVVTGQLDLDDQLNLKVSGLSCAGDGGMANLACGVLTPHLRKIDGREFPLMSLPLGETRLRDVRVTVDDNLSITAEFGSAS